MRKLQQKVKIPMLNASIIGNLGRDWEKRSTTAGDVDSTSCAVSEGKDKTIWVKLDAWGKTGERISQFSRKGSKIGVSGRFTLETWEKDGKTSAQIKINVADFTLCDKREDVPATAQTATQSALAQPLPEGDDIPF